MQNVNTKTFGNWQNGVTGQTLLVSGDTAQAKNAPCTLKHWMT